MGHRIPSFAALATGCALTLSVSAQAEEAADASTAAQDHPTATQAASTARPPQAPHPRETLTGDWGGLRTSLKDAGVAVRADYVSETFSAVDGGERRGTAYVQQLRAGIDLDMDRIAGVEGGAIHVTLNDRRGIGISSDFVGNRLPIQEAAGGYYTRLSELSWEQNFDGGRLNMRAGFFAMGNDLGGLSIGCNLVNAAFCAHPLSESGSTGWYNYPNARWGLAVRYKLRPDLIVRTGVYQTNPDLGLEKNAFRPFAGKTTGVVLPLELEYDPGTAPGSHVLPGHYKLGFYYDTANAARQGAAGQVSGRFGGYVLGDQMILRDRGGNKKRGLSIFGHFTANPEQSAQITRWYAGGLLKLGTFKGRDDDTIALGIIHAQVNERLRALHAELPDLTEGYTALPEGETAIELSYGIQVNRWLNIRPDIQYIVDPGAFTYTDTHDALALGVQVKMQI
ncbi:carbohydrate porin [Novosphingobium guangzhouense]|uniref:Porin n=1 Tax=Novosphingobium guangzhouense TaxID=1850347 RepID=A0A2K2G6V4_9SPHN|nr:carbohydrate porin [Novosphingobium guangzhouense]PNU06773.1 porin [Novosphingobium guangzhouense]